MEKIINWNKLEWINGNLTPSSKRDLNQALNYWARKPERQAKEILAAGAQEFATAGDFTAQYRKLMGVSHLKTVYDLGWMELFEMLPTQGLKADGFDVGMVQSALTFQLTEVGEKALVYPMMGQHLTVYFNQYAAGLGWSRSMIERQQFWQLERNAVEFRNKAGTSKARVHYLLIEAVPAANNLAWQAPDPAALAVTDPVYTANRDAQTINAACLQLLTLNANKGYSNVGEDGLTATFAISCPVQLLSRMQKAVALMLQAFAQSQKSIAWDVRIIPTTMYAATNVYYVIIPKNGMVHGDEYDLTIYTDFDILSRSDLAVGWQSFGTAICDTDVIVRCATV